MEIIINVIAIIIMVILFKIIKRAAIKRNILNSLEFNKKYTIMEILTTAPLCKNLSYHDCLMIVCELMDNGSVKKTTENQKIVYVKVSE